MRVHIVFVSFHFSKEDETLAQKFMELFSLEGLNPISGKIARPEDVDDKVRALIDQSAGVIVLFTKDKELKEGGWTTSPWLGDEKAFAIGRGKPVLLFYEDVISSTQRKGIHGALEYVEFNRQHLEDAFLEAMPYLRDFRQRLLTSR